MTETITYLNATIPGREDWDEGPWLKEPDKEQWEDPTTGLPCLIVRNDLGALCGYVGVEPGHPLHGVSYDEVGLDCHGELTFASGCSHGDPAHSVCHVPAPGRSDDVWWFGFDCGHYNDLIPGAAVHGWSRGVYRDWAYVKNEVTKLAQQLKESA